MIDPSFCVLGRESRSCSVDVRCMDIMNTTEVKTTDKYVCMQVRARGREILFVSANEMKSVFWQGSRGGAKPRRSKLLQEMVDNMMTK